MPGWAWSADSVARQIKYIWVKTASGAIRPVLKAWVWDGTEAILWYQQGASGVEVKSWQEAIEFSAEEDLRAYVVYQDNATLLLVGYFWLSPELRDVPFSVNEEVRFTSLEDLFITAFWGAEGTVLLEEDWILTPEARLESELSWSEQVGFSAEEDVQSTTVAPYPPSNLILADFSTCQLGEPDPAYCVQLRWDAGDILAQTRIKRDGDLIETLDPGIEEYLDEYVLPAAEVGYAISHVRSGFTSSEISDVLAVDALTCGPTDTPECSSEDASGCEECEAGYQIDVTASRGSDTLSDLFVDRRVGGGAWVEVATGSFSDTDLVDGYSYAYRSRLTLNGVDVTSAQTSSILVSDPCVVPEAPELTVTPAGATVLQVEVGVVADGEVYLLYRSPNYGTGQQIATLYPEDLTYDDESRSPDTQYCYKAEAVNDQGCSSGLSSETCGTTFPLVPKSFSGVLDEGNCPSVRIGFSWDNGGRSESKTCQVYDNVASDWDSAFTATSGATGYQYHTPSAEHFDGNDVHYRIKFDSESDWATDTVNAICPE